MKSKVASASSRAEMKCAPFNDRRNVGGLSLPEVVQNLLREGSLRWDANDSAYIVVDGDVFEARSEHPLSRLNVFFLIFNAPCMTDSISCDEFETNQSRAVQSGRLVECIIFTCSSQERSGLALVPVLGPGMLVDTHPRRC